MTVNNAAGPSEDSLAWARCADPDVPSPARIYDYLLGGFHNFAADRDAAHQLLKAMPYVAAIARANRAFLHRAVRFLTAEGITQYLDVGSGIPTVGNVHEIARRTNPDARVAYVDIDSVAVTHSRHLLAGDPGATAILGDLRQPQAILDHPDLHAVLDLDRPVGLLLVSMLHFVGDADDPHTAVAHLRDALAPGSHLVLSHATTGGFDPDAVTEAQQVYRHTATGVGQLRDPARIGAFLGDFDLILPGLVWLPDWKPDPHDPAMSPFAAAQDCSVLCAVGYKSTPTIPLAKEYRS